MIESVDDVPIKSLPAMRRALRTGVFWGSSIIVVRRGNDTLTRVVHFGETAAK